MARSCTLTSYPNRRAFSRSRSSWVSLPSALAGATRIRRKHDILLDRPLHEIASTPKVGWTGTTPQGVPIQLFISTRKNPRPGVEISSLDYVSKMTQAGPFLVAITVEPEG